MSNWPNWNLVESSRRSAMSIVNSKPPNLIRELDYSCSTFLGTFLLLFSTHEKFQLSQQKLDLRSICFVNNEIFTPVNALGSCVVFWNIRNETFANCNRLAIEPFKWNSIFRRINVWKFPKQLHKKHDHSQLRAIWTKRVYISIKTELRSTVALTENRFVCWVCARVSEWVCVFCVLSSDIYSAMYISFMCIVYPHFVTPNASPPFYSVLAQQGALALWHSHTPCTQ